MLEASVTVSPNLEAALKALKPDVMRRAIGAGMVRATELIKGQIERKRLTGKGPFPPSQNKLGVITGRLRQNLTYSKDATVNGDAIKTHIGSNVKYLAAHEFGFAGTEQVAAFTRRRVALKTNRAGKLTKKVTKRLKQALQSFGSNSVQVRAHKRKVNIPERAPIRTGIKDNFALIDREIALAVKRELNAST